MLFASLALLKGTEMLETQGLCHLLVLVAHIVYMVKPGNTLTIGTLKTCHWAKRLSGRSGVVNIAVSLKTAGDTSSCFRFTLMIRVRTCVPPTCFGHPGMAGWPVPVGWAAWS